MTRLITDMALALTMAGAAGAALAGVHVFILGRPLSALCLFAAAAFMVPYNLANWRECRRLADQIDAIDAIGKKDGP